MCSQTGDLCSFTAASLVRLSEARLEVGWGRSTSVPGLGLVSFHTIQKLRGPKVGHQPRAPRKQSNVNNPANVRGNVSCCVSVNVDVSDSMG